MKQCIVFWQRMLTPHMTELARELAIAGADVHYVAEQPLSEERRRMGWRGDAPPGVTVHFISSRSAVQTVLNTLSKDAVHLTQGVRANGLIGVAQEEIAAGKCRHYPMMEKVDLRGVGRYLKPVVYARRFKSIAGEAEGLLAIGEGTSEWIAARAPAALRPIPFAYFLRSKQPSLAAAAVHQKLFKFIYVGTLSQLKRVDLMLEALSTLVERPFLVDIVGDGAKRVTLERQATLTLPERVSFKGTLSMDDAIRHITAADCLVLPSTHDGWGAVVSEAHINGTPAICSSECGAATAVRASGFGAVFDSGDVNSLRRCLAAALANGPIDCRARERLSTWSTRLTAKAGARYLLDIISQSPRASRRIAPPWDL